MIRQWGSPAPDSLKGTDFDGTSRFRRTGRGVDRGRLRQDAVEVEQAGAHVVGEAEHGSLLPQTAKVKRTRQWLRFLARQALMKRCWSLRLPESSGAVIP